MLWRDGLEKVHDYLSTNFTSIQLIIKTIQIAITKHTTQKYKTGMHEIISAYAKKSC